MTNKYHNYYCSNDTRGIDKLLNSYKLDRESIIYQLSTNPQNLINTIWKKDSLLAIDNECMCQMGNCEYRSFFICSQCKNLKRISNCKEGVKEGRGRKFKIECGNKTGKQLMIVNNGKINEYLNWDQISEERVKYYMSNYKNLSLCGTNIQDINSYKCISGDSFTIKLLLWWLIEKQFEQLSLPHIQKLYTGFICNKIGYILQDDNIIGDIKELHRVSKYHEIDKTSTFIKSRHFVSSALKSDIVLTIITQLLVILLELMRINFNHGNPSINSLVFSREPVSYMYNSFHVHGEITVVISDLDNSSATYNNIHYFTKNIKSNLYIERNLFVPEIVTKRVTMAYCEIDNSSNCDPNNVLFYRLNNSTLEIYNSMRHIGFPLFSGSFDFYCLFISLLCDKSFYDCVINDTKLYKVFMMMFLKEDIIRVEEKIRERHNFDDNISVIDIVKGCWLRCDIVQFIWKIIING